MPPQILHLPAKVRATETIRSIYLVHQIVFMMMQLLAGIVVVTPEEKEVMKMRAKLLATFRWENVQPS